MKDAYYEPGLLTKLLGYSDQPLRDVPALEKIGLFPEVTAEIDQVSSQLKIGLTNQGGGIGRVQVFVGEKEYRADARTGQQVNPNDQSARVTVNLTSAPSRIPGMANKVRVRAWNIVDGREYLHSEDLEVTWAAPVEADNGLPRFYAIVGGISTYSGDRKMD